MMRQDMSSNEVMIQFKRRNTFRRLLLWRAIVTSMRKLWGGGRVTTFAKDTATERTATAQNAAALHALERDSSSDSNSNSTRVAASRANLLSCLM
mmetsp:Transcript_10085/g.13896  ORF Transcript_10085/g.13896 Transcript_10085/m.13896 type:complete len:95 (-) Transcript_10085:48-332(-)